MSANDQEGIRNVEREAEGSADAADDQRRRTDDPGRRRTAEPPALGDATDDAARDVDGLDRHDDGVAAAELIEEEVERAVERVISSKYSGPVPTPDLLHAYDDDERERIFRIAEAFSSDESRRRDKIVESSVGVAERAQWISPAMLVVAFVFAAGSYALFENVILSGLFVSIPVLRVVGSSVVSAVRKRRSDDDE